MLAVLPRAPGSKRAGRPRIRPERSHVHRRHPRAARRLEPEIRVLQVDIRCFQLDPSVASSLEFLRRTPWARAKIESLYGFMLRERARAERAGR